MHIVFFCLAEHGGYLPTFQLTKRFLSLGHRGNNFGPVEFEGRVHGQGFDYVTLYGEKLLKGMIDSRAISHCCPEPGWRMRIHRMSSWRHVLR
jgi:hypothetical protein